jgi:hypothetical protein
MYAMATKVTTPPRISRPKFDPLVVIEKNWSTRLRTVGAGVAVLVTEILYCQQILRHESPHAEKSRYR